MSGETVKLISAEGFEFVIDKKAACVSKTIHNMLTSPGSFAEREHGEVTFPEISTTILEKICQYFHWSLQYASHRCAYLCKLHLSVPSGKETEFHIEPELTLELMMAANYLHT
ncbi:general transcription factor [Lithospermum erythrorhizon]|uniref:Elongin-C n=1 Tax=Lithospermum erythrorhizon TaxID=34254 RepID=A0AAV3PA51_LITER